MAEKHQIQVPVCLYDESDLLRLGQAVHVDAIAVFRSGFGNIKGVFSKR